MNIIKQELIQLEPVQEFEHSGEKERVSKQIYENEEAVLEVTFNYKHAYPTDAPDWMALLSTSETLTIK